MYVISAIFSLTILGLFLGFLLAIAGKYLKVESSPIVDELESLSWLQASSRSVS
jgi:Na+-translocating ferredoxin:NAD+ oxidoreductase subunit B